MRASGARDSSPQEAFRTRFLLALVFLCTLSAVAHAETIVVLSPADGSDGTMEMADAFDLLDDGDTIVFSKGTCSGAEFVFQKNDVRIVGPRGAVLDGVAIIGILRLNECTNVTVSGLEFVCTTSSGVASDEPKSTYTFDGNKFGTESFPLE